jgi:hypothetical protein
MVQDRQFHRRNPDGFIKQSTQWLTSLLVNYSRQASADTVTLRQHHKITHLPHGFLDANIVKVLIRIVNFIIIIDRGAANA